MQKWGKYVLDYETPLDAKLQEQVEAIDAALRTKHDISPGQVALGVLDLKHLRLAMVHADRLEYAASLAKLGILLAYFHLHSEAAAALPIQIRHELGLMIKASSNEMATRFSQQL